jgi:hypothetical protein
MLRVDDKRGAKCEMRPSSERSTLEVLRKLKRLRTWANHFGLSTRLDPILEWVKAGPHKEPLHVPT